MKARLMALVIIACTLLSGCGLTKAFTQASTAVSDGVVYNSATVDTGNDPAISMKINLWEDRGEQIYIEFYNGMKCLAPKSRVTLMYNPPAK